MFGGAKGERGKKDVISFASFLPENNSLRRLDISSNSDIELSGMIALASFLRLNEGLYCLDLDTTPGNTDMAACSRDIFNSCVRNFITQYKQQQT